MLSIKITEHSALKLCPYVIGKKLDISNKYILERFETDWRDAYPRVNALSLIEIKDPTDPRIRKLFPRTDNLRM